MILYDSLQRTKQGSTLTLILFEGGVGDFFGYLRRYEHSGKSIYIFRIVGGSAMVRWLFDGYSQERKSLVWCQLQESNNDGNTWMSPSRGELEACMVWESRCGTSLPKVLA